MLEFGNEGVAPLRVDPKFCQKKKKKKRKMAKCEYNLTLDSGRNLNLLVGPDHRGHEDFDHKDHHDAAAVHYVKWLSKKGNERFHHLGMYGSFKREAEKCGSKIDNKDLLNRGKSLLGMSDKHIEKGDKMDARERLLGYLNKAEKIHKEGSLVSFTHKGNLLMGRVAHHLGDGHYLVHAGKEQAFKVHNSEMEPSTFAEYKKHLSIKKSESPRDEMLEWMEKAGINPAKIKKKMRLKFQSKTGKLPIPKLPKMDSIESDARKKAPTAVGIMKKKLKKSVREEMTDWLSKTKKNEKDLTSTRPPKKWFHAMVKKVKSKKVTNPEAVVGHIWYHRMKPAKRAEKREAEGKNYGVAPKRD